MRKPKTIAFSAEALRLNMEMLSAALGVEKGYFGRRPSYAPDVKHYSDCVATFLAIAPTRRVEEAKRKVLAGGHSFDFKKDEDIAGYRLMVAREVLGE